MVFPKDYRFVFFIIVLSLQYCKAGKTSTKWACVVKGKIHFHGEKFTYEDKQGCIKNCTCVIKNKAAYGNCTQSCDELIYPAACQLVRNACGCATSYTCPDNGKCKDIKTGQLYDIGETWINGYCACLCLGEVAGIRNGAYQCECLTTLQLNASRQNNFKAEVPCKSDSTIQCYHCTPAENGTRTPQCAIRQKCEKWTYEFVRNQKRMSLVCTCYGPNGFVQCLKRSSRKKRFAGISSSGEFALSKVLHQNQKVGNIQNWTLMKIVED